MLLKYSNPLNGYLSIRAQVNSFQPSRGNSTHHLFHITHINFVTLHIVDGQDGYPENLVLGIFVAYRTEIGITGQEQLHIRHGMVKGVLQLAVAEKYRDRERLPYIVTGTLVYFPQQVDGHDIRLEHFDIIREYKNLTVSVSLVKIGLHLKSLADRTHRALRSLRSRRTYGAFA